MAWLNLTIALTTIFTFLFFRSTAISTTELDGVLTLLRAQNHMLFANAISTSDMLFDILSVENLTLLSPTDPTVFALDMTNTPPLYISTLRLHALPIRLSWSQIRLLSNNSLLSTLSSVHQLRLVRYQLGRNVLAVDGGEGVEVVMPGLYYSTNVAVHALGGILNFRSKIPTTNTTTKNINKNTINKNSNLTIFLSPTPPRIPILNHTSKSNRTVSSRIPIFNDTSSRTVPPRIPILNDTSNLPPRCAGVNHARATHSLVHSPPQLLPLSPSASPEQLPSPAPSPSAAKRTPSSSGALAPNRERDEVLESEDICVVE